MSFKCNGNIEDYVHDFCYDYLTELVTENDATLGGYDISYVTQSNRNRLKKEIYNYLDTTESLGDMDIKKVITDGIVGIFNATTGSVFTTEMTMTQRGSKMFIKDSKIRIVALTDIIREEILLNLYRLDEWLHEDVALQLRHEIGHCISDVASDGMSVPAWVDEYRKNRESRREYEKWKKEAQTRDDYDREEDVKRYYSIPEESDANAIMCITMDELIKVSARKKSESNNYGVEIKSFKVKK